MRAPPDDLIVQIAKYVVHPPEFSQEAYETARLALYDALGCALYALRYNDCVKRITPLFDVDKGFPIIGTSLIADPINAAFSNGSLIRWLDFNDTWLGKEWGHPSDNLGALLSALEGKSVKELFEAMIKAYEIQGILALSNSFNKIGLDHVILVKIASAAVSTFYLGGDEDAVIRALTNAFADLGPLRIYRHQPNVGPRKSWAAGDACSRALFHAYHALRGEMGYPSVLSTPKWGFEAVLFQGNKLTIERPLKDYVMRHILFKTLFPAEFHAQTAVEAAISLHSKLKIEDIEKIEVETHESAIRIIDKKGPLHNPADRDHCLQYMIAIGLIKGSLEADDYESEVAKDPRIDLLRSIMEVKENEDFSKDYLDPNKRSIANKLTIYLKGMKTPLTKTVEYPIGHRFRRDESLPELFKKFERNLRSRTNMTTQTPDLLNLFHDQRKTEALSISELMALFTPIS